MSGLPETALEGRVRGHAQEGDAVVETERGIVFAPGGVAGDRVRLEDVRKDGKVLRARRIVLLEASPERVEAACAHVNRCGGCPLMTTSAGAQAEAKRATVERALVRVPRAAGATPPIGITSPEATIGYRGRARLAWARTGQGVRLGFRMRRGDRIADIDRCIVLRPELDAILAVVRARVAEHLPGTGELQLALGQGGLPVIVIDTPDAPPRALYAAVEQLLAERAIAGASIRGGGASVATVHGEPREMGSDVEGRALLGTVGGFSQAHHELNVALGARVIALAEADGMRVLELYAGHGNLTLALASRAAHLRAVEVSKPATDALRMNLAAHRLADRVEVIWADAARSIPARGIDVVVLDPPRAGAKEAIEPIVRLAPARVIYVSCDPATLGRDLERLGSSGYGLDAASAFDMFPQTTHVETVARMIRLGL